MHHWDVPPIFIIRFLLSLRRRILSINTSCLGQSFLQQLHSHLPVYPSQVRSRTGGRYITILNISSWTNCDISVSCQRWYQLYIMSEPSPLVPQSRLPTSSSSNTLHNVRLPDVLVTPPSVTHKTRPVFSGAVSPIRARMTSFSAGNQDVTTDGELYSPTKTTSSSALPDITNLTHCNVGAGLHPNVKANAHTSYDNTVPSEGRTDSLMETWDKSPNHNTHDATSPFSTFPSNFTENVDDDDDDDDDGAMDVPDRFTIGAAAAAARLDLRRCTVRVHRQLIQQIKSHSMKPASTPLPEQPCELLRCQGEIWLKSRVPMIGWKKRYGSIVDHSYFGPVLVLFRYDQKGNIALQNSMMIVLVDSEVRLSKNTLTKDGQYRCEFVLKSTKRRYVFAASHTMRRDFWMRNLESIQEKTAVTPVRQ